VNGRDDTDTADRSAEGVFEKWLVDRHWDRIIFGVSIVAFVVTYLVYFPHIYATEDDASYLAQAFALRHGHLTLDSLHQNVVQAFTVGHHLVSQYPPGMPALLAAASVFGWTAALGVNLVVILATCGVVAYLLRRHRLPIIFALLYLLYPTAVLFSRTVMTDLLSGLLVAAAIATVIDKRPLITGLLLGVAVLVRDANVLACATVPAGVLFDMWRHGSGPDRRRQAIRWSTRYGAGLVPGAALAAITYYAVDGGQSLSHTGQFALHYLPHHLPYLVIGLLMMYPLMLFAPLFFRSPARSAVLLTSYGFLLLYGSWFFQDQGSTRSETLILAQRFMLAALPLFVLAYAGAVCALGRRFRLERVGLLVRLMITGAVAAVLVVGSFAVQRTDQHHAAVLVSVRTELLKAVSPTDLLVCDKEVAKLILPQWGSRDIYIVDQQPPAAVGRYIDAWELRNSTSGRRALVADWSGGGLGGEIGGDRSAAVVVEALLPTTPIPVAPLGLPSDFQLLTVNPH
jgi:hypothetical protein